MPITPAQEAAIRANGNVLVAAGAGAGKTSTLVERCVDRLLDPQKPARLDDILMVTFTESAAAEMRARVRQKLEAASPSWEYIHTHFGIGYRFAPERTGNGRR